MISWVVSRLLYNGIHFKGDRGTTALINKLSVALMHCFTLLYNGILMVLDIK
jgi:hypothetical protein